MLFTVEAGCQVCGAAVPGPRWKVCGSINCKRARGAAAKARKRAAFSSEEREAQRAYDREWAAAHKDRIKAKNRRQYLADPERYALQRDEWRKRNPGRHLELMLLQQGKRRAAKRSADSRKVSAEDIAKMFQMARGCCFYCQRKAVLTIDHIIPLVRGGRHAIGNLAPACEKCNKSKGALLLVEWRIRALAA